MQPERIEIRLRDGAGDWRLYGTCNKYNDEFSQRIGDGAIISGNISDGVPVVKKPQARALVKKLTRREICPVCKHRIWHKLTADCDTLDFEGG